MSTESLEIPTDQPPDDEIVFPITDQNNKVLEKSAEDLNIVDVYNIASSVGFEFEKLTDAFGGAIFVGVMPKIIRVLEILETLVAKRHEEVQEITELKSKVQKLEIDVSLKNEKHKEELEIIESSWRDETRDLLISVKSLEEENQKFVQLLNEKIKEENANVVQYSIPDNNSKTLGKLQEQIQKQREEIKLKNRENDEKNLEVDALQSQIQRLTKLNVGLRQKVALLEQQGKSLIEEKADMESRFKEKEKSNLDLQMKTLPTSQPGTPIHETPPNPHQDPPTDNWPGDPLLANKLVIDLSDPNRPRYTLQELQEVLNDRNRLKSKCFLLEEEISFLKGEESWEELNLHEIKESSKVATAKPKQGGIRKFFSYLTGDAMWRKSEDQVDGKVCHQVVDPLDQQPPLSSSDIERLLPEITGTDNDVAEDDVRPTSSEMSEFGQVSNEIEELNP